jgi:hypothetical protein
MAKPDVARAESSLWTIRLSASKVLSVPLHGIYSVVMFLMTASDSVSPVRRIRLMKRGIEDSEKESGQLPTEEPRLRS